MRITSRFTNRITLIGHCVPLIFQRPGVVNSDAESLTMRKYPIRP